MVKSPPPFFFQSLNIRASETSTIPRKGGYLQAFFGASWKELVNPSRRIKFFKPSPTMPSGLLIFSFAACACPTHSFLPLSLPPHTSCVLAHPSLFVGELLAIVLSADFEGALHLVCLFPDMVVWCTRPGRPFRSRGSVQERPPLSSNISRRSTKAGCGGGWGRDAHLSFLK